MLSSQLTPGQKEVILDGDEFTVNGPVDLDLVKIRNAPGDSLVLASGATGRIKRVEIDTSTEDGIKVQNASVQAAHDFTIDEGYVTAHGSAPGAHQDGIQVMGGRDLTFRNIVFKNFNTQGVFVNKAGSGATNPTDIVFDGCSVPPSDPAVTDGPATPMNINGSLRTVVRNCKIAKSKRFDHGLTVGSGAVDEVLENNQVFEQGEWPVDPPDPPDPPVQSLPLHVVSEDATTITLGWDEVNDDDLIGFRFTREMAPVKPNGQKTYSTTWELDRVTCKFSKDSAWYSVEAMLRGPNGRHET